MNYRLAEARAANCSQIATIARRKKISAAGLCADTVIAAPFLSQKDGAKSRF